MQLVVKFLCLIHIKALDTLTILLIQVIPDLRNPKYISSNLLNGKKNFTLKKEKQLENQRSFKPILQFGC